MGYLYDSDERENDIERLRKNVLHNSEEWFPEVHVDRKRLLLHSALGLAGETGEAVDIIKKWHRKDRPIDEVDKEALGAELADVLIYLLHICSAAEIDLPQAVNDKIELNFARFARS